MKKVLLIINPSAGNEKAKLYLDRIKEKLTSSFDCIDVKETRKANDARNFAKEAAQEAYDSVFVMGGDGTVNEVINGLAEQLYRPKLGLIPLGTVNDLVRSLNLPLDPQQAIDTFDFTHTQFISIAKINQQYFSNVVAIGDIPTAVQDTPISDKTKFGKFAYFLQGVKSALKPQTYTFQLTLDGNDLPPFESSLLLLGLTNSVAGFEQVFPEANEQTGYIHLAYLKDHTLLDRLASLPELIGGITSESNHLGYHKISQATIRVQAPHSLSTNVDGEPGPSLPVNIHVLPYHLEVYSS